MNRVILMGRLTKDVEIRNTKNQKGEDMSIGNSTLAVNRPGKDAGADFINFSVYGKQADNLAKYVKKGGQVLLEGSWRTGSYDNKEGVKVYTNILAVSRIEFVGSSSNGTSGSSNPVPQPTQEQQGQTVVDEQPDADGFYAMDDDELPFQ